MDAFGTDFDAEDFSGDTPGFADVLAGLVNGYAVVGAGGGYREEEEYERDMSRNPAQRTGARCRALPDRPDEGVRPGTSICACCIPEKHAVILEITLDLSL
jgi:hypothetical protein